MAAHALPLDPALGLGQRRGREPADAEAQGQGVADDESTRVAAGHVAQRARAVGGAAVEHAAIVGVDVVLRGAVQQDVEMGADVHVAELQGAGEGEDEGGKLGLEGLLADELDMGGGSGGQAAREGCVAVDVELE